MKCQLFFPFPLIYYFIKERKKTHWSSEMNSDGEEDEREPVLDAKYYLEMCNSYTKPMMEMERKT